MKINEFSIERLHNTGDCAFQERVVNATSLLTDENDQEMIVAFKVPSDDFCKVVKMKTSYNTTQSVVELDELVDSAWRGLSGQAKVMQRHPSAQVVKAANEAVAIIDRFGDVTNMSYNDEYGAIDGLVENLKALGDEKLQSIYLTDWIAELELRRKEFGIAQAAREEEKAEIEIAETKTKRTAADRAYRNFVEMVNAKALVLGLAPYEAFIKRVNVIIDEAKFELAQRSSVDTTPETPAE